ncbi:hypothetical protein GQX73_g7655 [Xylaria multiplex]|uniref:Glycosyl transferase CAP10 domain-containing protein n=1 Tax=Xylaria multiplex TaxID=323545 RepID=A0A7C8N3R9_9PEZI|nr:hypothetical protein GQX73_g7655 [Xylaria multiplex]
MSQELASELGVPRGIASPLDLGDHFTWQSELTSELVCWALLPVIFSITKRRRNADGDSKFLPLVKSLPELSEKELPPTVSLWLVAIGIVIYSVFRAEIGIAVLFPALAPLLTIGHKYLRPGLHPPSGCHMSFFPFLTHHTVGTILTAIFSTLALWEWDPAAYAISAIPVVALFAVYTLLTPHAGQRSLSIDIEAIIWPLSLRVAILLAIVLGRESYLIGSPKVNVTEILTSGSAKALTWYFTSQLARNCSWLVAAVAGAFSLLATRDPITQHTDTRALMTVVASLVSLGRTIYLLPKHARSRTALWALALVPLLPYFYDLAAIHHARSSTLVHVDKHPVEALIRQANVNFDTLLRNQSGTYAAAYAEYQRRYGFEPPHGFEDWYKFARSHQSRVIDEFDIISEGIAPFLRLSGQEVMEVMAQVYDKPEHELWYCETTGQPAKTLCSHHGRGYDRGNAHFFDRITEQIPETFDLKFLFNHLDEPGVVLPPPSHRVPNPVITDLGGQHVWDAVTIFCSTRKRTTNSERQSPVETYGLPFITDIKSSMDLCEHEEYAEWHGLLASPESLRLIEGLVPVLSNGAPSTMGDILYPSSAYIEEDRFAYYEEHDVDWDKKQNNLYWAGSTTGGHGRMGEWQNLHRQRFVELAQNLKRRTFSYLREKGGVIKSVASSFLNGRLYDVAFASMVQCDADACREQNQYFTSKPWASGDRPYGSRLAFDLDGNGISGRFYKLLMSKSVPLKQTIIREWHDERLVPWVHYIPVSPSMEELPELVLYLTSTKTGQMRARQIAEQGRQWFSQSMREIDIVIYMYRLFLELERLQDPDRPAWQVEAGT